MHGLPSSELGDGVQVVFGAAPGQVPQGELVQAYRMLPELATGQRDGLNRLIQRSLGIIQGHGHIKG